MAKFLGLDSINVLKDYIDDRIASVNGETRIITIQAYTYVKDDADRPSAPNPSTAGGSFDVNAASYIYPTGWTSLKAVIEGIESGAYDENITDLDEALSVGSIWMTVGVITGADNIPDEYSKPVKISGQNGVSIKFAYSYDKDATVEKRYDNPKGPDSENQVEYVWTKVGDTDWQGPAIFAMYAESGKDTLYLFKATSERDEEFNPIVPATPGAVNDWSNTIGSLSLSPESPFLWMCTKTVVAGNNGNGVPWNAPVLIGRWGEDGNVPDYTYTIYCKGNDNSDFPELPGIVAPETPTFEEKQPIEFYLKDDWVDLPKDDDAIWWQCSLMVDGHRSVVTEIGAVKRYNALDGVAKPGPYTKYLYSWSPNQNAPALNWEDLNEDGWSPKGWYETPDYDKAADWEGDINSASPDASLWVISGVTSGIDAEGKPNITEWTAPYRLSGPRGPISYDYRIETRYMYGTETAPYKTSDDIPWEESTDNFTLNASFPYIWAKNYLVYYIMKYGDDMKADGSYDIVQASDKPSFVKDADGKFITYGEYRLSGLNGVDGSKRNTLAYNDLAESSEITVESFMTNMYISNSASDAVYNINFDEYSFITGYTGKFANIGTANMVINSNDIAFIGSCTTSNSIVLAPQESVELVCNRTATEKQLLVIGKAL